MEPADAVEDPSQDGESQRVLRRNFGFHIANGLFAGFGDALIDTRVIITAFLSQLTTSDVLIGLIAPLRDTGWFLPQLFITQSTERAPQKIAVYRAVTLVRAVIWVALVGSMFLIANPIVLLVAFAVLLGAQSIASGFAGLPFMIVTTKVIPPTRRGTLFALRQSLGGILGILAGGAVALILSGELGLPFPQNFGVLFAAAAVLNVLGNIVFGLITERADPVPTRQPHMRGEMLRAWRIARRDGQFQRYMLARVAIIAASASVPFLTVFARRELGVSDSLLGLLVSVTLASALLTNIVWARLSDKRGNRLTMLIGAAVGLASCGLAMAMTSGLAGASGDAAQAMLIVIFAVGGASSAAINVGASPLIMELAPPERRALYFGLTNTLLGITMLATSLIGIIVERFGFTVLFALSAAAFALAAVMLYMLREPRDA